MSSCLPSKINNSNQQKKKHISFKKRQVPKLTHKLHKLQPTIPNGLGSKILGVSNRKIGQGKRQIWNGYDNSLLLSKKHLQVIDKVNVKQKIMCYKQANLIPNVESKRAFWVFKLKKQFTSNC